MNILTLLTVLFIGLKLCGVITWNWFLVLAPLWAIPVFFILAAIGVCILAAYKEFFGT